MARRRNATPDPTREALFAEFPDAAPNVRVVKPKPRRPPSAAPSLGSIIGSLISTILTAAIWLIIVAVLAAGLVLAGRRTGVLPEVGIPNSITSNFVQPAAVNYSVSVPEVAPPSDESVAAMMGNADGTITGGVPVEVVQSACPEAADWWEQFQPAYDAWQVAYARYAFSPSGTSPENMLTSLQGQTVRLQDDAPAACLANAREQLLNGAAEANAALAALQAGDRDNAETRGLAAEAALVSLTTSLWDLGITTDESAATALAVARGGGEECDTEAWYPNFVEQWRSFSQAAAQIDVVSSSPYVIQSNLPGVQAVRTNLNAIAAPACAEQIDLAAKRALDSYVAAINNALEGNTDGAQEEADTYARARIILNAWLSWLGLPTV